jgi:hypothetical protein
MIVITNDVIWFSICYTFLIAVIALFYNYTGYREGIVDCIETLKQYEPEAIERASNKMKLKAQEND